MQDILAEKTLEVIKKSGEPLETKEIQQLLEEQKVKGVTRTKLFYRLTNFRGEGLIKGKFVGPGKGVWIWWTPEIFSQSKGGRK
jgi:repressor of nif and glnA expression